MACLYKKSSKKSTHHDDCENEDIWDDTLLIHAYDKAVKKALAEVKKRDSSAFAEDTNDRPSQRSEYKEKNLKKTEPIRWETGMHCRVVYKADGKEYEAYIKKMMKKNKCVVAFIGYRYYQIVPVSMLKPSLGLEAQKLQSEEALNDKMDDIPSLNNLKRKSISNFNNSQVPNLNAMPGMPSAETPNIGMPLLPPELSQEVFSEDQALSSMLHSWYLSGYYTGLYEGLKSPNKSGMLQ